MDKIYCAKMPLKVQLVFVYLALFVVFFVLLYRYYR